MKKGLLATTAMERVKDLDKLLEDRILDAVVDCLDMPEVPENMVFPSASVQDLPRRHVCCASVHRMVL